MKMKIQKAVVKRIRELCAERNITINALSYQAGISQSTLKSITNGESLNTGIVTIKKICDGLDISIVDFFDTDYFKSLEQEL